MRRIFIYALAAFFWRMYTQTAGGDHRGLAYFAFVLWNFIAALGLALGTPIGIAVGVAALLLAYPWPIARAVFIPLGLWWPALWLGRAAALTWTSGGGAIAGALALAHQRTPSARGVARVDAELRRGRLTANKIVAAGLLAASRGDRATAVALAESLELLDVGNAPRAHRFARDLLIADAAETGDWRRARDLALLPLPTSRLARFVGLAAARLTGDDAVTDGQLWRGWLTARRRLRSLPLLRRALADPTDATDDPTPRSAIDPDVALFDGVTDGDPIGAALSGHLELLRCAPEVEIDDLLALGSLWDRAIDSGALHDHARQRAADLRAPNADRAADAFAAEIESEIASLVRHSGVCMELIPRGSAILDRAIAAVRRELLAEIELAFAALEIRYESDRCLDPIDEWREMLALRKLHADAARIGGLPLRQIAFPQMHTPACNYAVWLWNTRAEYLVADTIFHWLLAEATVVGDAEAIDLQLRNIAD